MGLFSRKSQPKDERPPLQGYGDNLQGSAGETSLFPVYYRSPVVPPSDPPQGGSVIARPPRPQVDYRLIGEDQR